MIAREYLFGGTSRVSKNDPESKGDGFTILSHSDEVRVAKTIKTTSSEDMFDFALICDAMQLIAFVIIRNFHQEAFQEQYNLYLIMSFRLKAKHKAYKRLESMI